MSSWCSSQRRLSSRRFLWWRSCFSFSCCLVAKSTSSISSLSWLRCPPLSRLPGDACRALGAAVGRRGEGRLGGARADILTCVPRGQLQGSGDTVGRVSEEAARFYRQVSSRPNPGSGLAGGQARRVLPPAACAETRLMANDRCQCPTPRLSNVDWAGEWLSEEADPIITYWLRHETGAIHFTSVTFSSEQRGPRAEQRRFNID